MIGLRTPSVAGTIEANHRLHMLLPRIQSRLAALAATQAQSEAEAETRSQAGPAMSQPAPALANDSDIDTDSASSDAESSGVITPPSFVEVEPMNIPIVLVTDHSDVVLSCAEEDSEAGGEGEGGLAGMTSLSYHGDLSELAKAREEEGKGMVGPFRFPVPRCDARELLSPQAVPRSMWTKKCRPVAAMAQPRHQYHQRQQQPQAFQFKPDAPISTNRVLEIEELGRLLEALSKQGCGVDFDEQRVRDREALGVLMERMRGEIEEEGVSRKEANLIMWQVVKSVGVGLQRKAEDEEQVGEVRAAEV